MSQIWKPSVVVAAIIEHEGRFLLVEEQTPSGVRINQPAGHLESGESLEQAVIRETLEETMHEFHPESLVGMYLLSYRSEQDNDITYLRFAFTGRLGEAKGQTLDPDILRTVWMTRDEIAACRDQHRSPLVLQCVDDYLQGRRASLSLLSTLTTPKGSYA